MGGVWEDRGWGGEVGGGECGGSSYMYDITGSFLLWGCSHGSRESGRGRGGVVFYWEIKLIHRNETIKGVWYHFKPLLRVVLEPRTCKQGHNTFIQYVVAMHVLIPSL